jgi:hypothetical protein
VRDNQRVSPLREPVANQVAAREARMAGLARATVAGEFGLPDSGRPKVALEIGHLVQEHLERDWTTEVLVHERQDPAGSMNGVRISTLLGKAISPKGQAEFVIYTNVIRRYARNVFRLPLHPSLRAF